MVRQFLVLFIFLASANFFSIIFLPRQILLLLSFASVILILFVVIIGLVYDTKRRFQYNFTFEIFLILLSSITAVFGAKWGHGQNYLLSLWIQHFIYYYLFYFFLHTIRIRPDDLLKLMIAMGIAFMFIWYAQYFIYPTKIVEARMDPTRGTLRLFLPGGPFAGFVFFYFLDLFLKTNKSKYIIFCLVFLMIPVLQGTRNSIATQLFFTLVFVLFSTQVKSKLRNIVLMLAGAILIFIIFQDIFINLIELTTQDSSSGEKDDVRVRATEFFLSEFYPNKINYIIGNGQGHMMSAYGMRIAFYKMSLGFYQSDLGTLGSYIQFGVLFVIGAILILRKILYTQFQKKHLYIKFWALSLIVTSILGSPFANPTSIVVITSVLYLIDVYSYELKIDEKN